jgi:peptidoglycan/xylan/chitin deacetylase (PgdA/CDA1 family)
MFWSPTPFTGRSLAQRKLVLSFDDGPGPGTGELAHFLAEQGIQALFFVVGRHVRQMPSVVSRLLELGHIVGNHSENHLRLTDCVVSDARAIEEFTRTDSVLRQFHIPQPRLFRPAYGAWNRRLADLFKHHPAISLNSIGPVNWDICGHDYQFWSERRSPEPCARAYQIAIERRKRGIVLAHDSSTDGDPASNRTFEMMRLLLPRLQDLGYTFASPYDVPEVRAAAHLGLRCALRGTDGKSVEVRLFPSGAGSVRMENSDGRALWPLLSPIAVSGNQVAFRNPDGSLMALRRDTTFDFVPLGAVSPTDSEFIESATLPLGEGVGTF